MQITSRGLAAILFLIITILYVLGLQYEFYLRTWIVDSAQHFLFGIALSLLWLEWARRKGYARSSMAILGFVLVVSLLWEFFELVLWTNFGEISNSLMLNSPTALDALTDMLSAAFGGLLSSTLEARIVRTV